MPDDVTFKITVEGIRVGVPANYPNQSSALPRQVGVILLISDR